MILTLSAASGVGKTTLQEALRRTSPREVHRLTSTTTRHKRGDEMPEQYEWVTQTEFGKIEAHGEFLEPYERYGNRYGTRKKLILEALDSSNIYVAELLVPAVQKFYDFARTHGKQSNIRSIFLDLNDEKERERRLFKRVQELSDAWDPKRAAAELEHWRHEVERSGIDFIRLDAAQKPYELAQQVLKELKL